MLISIITATLNSVSTIRSAIESVKNSYVQFEHIIIDGGSVDNTIEILKEYKHLIWISENDKGVYEALNKGIKLANGEWIYFLGSDDELTPGVLNKLEPYLRDDSLDMIYGNVWVKKTQKIYDGPFTKEKLLIHNICQQAIFYRQVLFQDRCFDQKYPIAADYAFNIPLFTDDKINIQYVDVEVANYDGGGLSEKVVDATFLRNKVSLFCQALHITRVHPFLDKYRHQEAINQILYGSIFLGWCEMLLCSFKTKNFFKNIRTAVGMSKQRLLKQ